MTIRRRNNKKAKDEKGKAMLKFTRKGERLLDSYDFEG
jgi:hypothetical protein